MAKKAMRTWSLKQTEKGRRMPNKAMCSKHGNRDRKR
jgi:hypothetical protein